MPLNETDLLKLVERSSPNCKGAGNTHAGGALVKQHGGRDYRMAITYETRQDLDSLMSEPSAQVRESI